MLFNAQHSTELTIVNGGTHTKQSETRKQKKEAKFALVGRMSGGSHYSSLNSLLSPHSLKRSRSNVNDEDSASSIISFRNTHISIIFPTAALVVIIRLSTRRKCCFVLDFELSSSSLWWWWYSLSLNLCNFASSFIAHVQARRMASHIDVDIYHTHSGNSSCHVVLLCISFFMLSE